MSTIAPPMNLINALAPPALAALLTSMGPQVVLGSVAIVSASAFALLRHLHALRNNAPVPAEG